MSAFAERWPAIQEKLLKNIDKIFVGGMAAVVAILGYFYVNEGSTPNLEPTPIEARPLAVAIDENGPEVAQVKGFFLFNDPFEKTPYGKLGEINMFDAKEIRDPEKLLADAKQKVSDARRLLQEKKLDEALRAVDEALRLQKDFAPAVELRAEIEAARQAAAPAPAAPAAAAPAGAAAAPPAGGA